MTKANESFQLYQHETICLGLLAQAEQLSARELVSAFMLDDVNELRPWLGRLQDLGLVKSAGRTGATRYFVDPDVMRTLDMPTTTTLGRIEPHRLEASITEDLGRYPRSKIGDISTRIGSEIPHHRLKRTLDGMLKGERVKCEGERKFRVYWLP